MSLENFVMTLNDFQDTVFGNNLIICRDIFLPYVTLIEFFTQ